MDPNFVAFTQRYAGRALRIITPAGISRPIRQGQEPEPEINVQALWDTGATASVIHPRVVRSLGLVPVGQCRVMTGGGPGLANTYVVDVYLPNHVHIHAVQTVECTDHNHGFDLIVGMDIISLGDLAFTNLNGESVVSFRMPSKETIDYVEEHELLKLPYRKGMKIGRNDSCPCGSGKKYKNCHGRSW